MENKKKEKIPFNGLSWMKKNQDNVIPVIIALLFISFFIAIFVPIDGLGIFSITSSIILLLIMAYRVPNPPDGGGGGSGVGILSKTQTPMEENASEMFDSLKSPDFRKQALKILISTVTSDKNIGKLEVQEIEEMQEKIKGFHDYLEVAKNNKTRIKPNNKR